MDISVIIPTHNPHPGRLARTLAGLRAQSLPAGQWEAILIDNASTDFPPAAFFAGAAVPGLRIVAEPALGLTPARLRGFRAAAAAVCVLADDDNVLDPDYLALVRDTFAADPGLGAAGGRSVPEFTQAPPAWTREFDGLLALRDPGDQPRRAAWGPGAPRAYPDCAPIGAGLAIRRAAAQAYAEALEGDPGRRAFDRTGGQLVSGGDNDLIMTVLEAGFAVAYLPGLRLTHLIPPRRSERAYLGALNRAIARSWVGVLARHGIAPWPPLRGGLAVRRVRAWFRARAWRGPAEWVRWQGRCGALEGRADLARISDKPRAIRAGPTPPPE